MDYIFEHNLQPQDRKSITRETVRIIEAFRRIHNPQISMRDVSGIFVTIEKDGQLRGCIGTFELIGDLLNTILDRTIQTAFNDSRFSMITKDEYESKSNPSSWHYKINFLGKPFAIEPNEIPSKLIVGLHGITAIFDNNRSATYLASVLPESFGVTQENLQTKIDEIIKSLRDKAGSSSPLVGVELYECREEKEHVVDA
jgi:AMMECR1 domain-containing protein